MPYAQQAICGYCARPISRDENDEMWKAPHTVHPERCDQRDPYGQPHIPAEIAKHIPADPYDGLDYHKGGGQS